jgi:tetratricopeptide (TPR) repeat protein
LSATHITNFHTIRATQTLINRRLLWLFLLPFLVAAPTVTVFFVLTAKLVDLEVATKLVTIERILEQDRNYPWAIDQYERISKDYSTAPILARLGVLYFRQDPKKNENIAIEKLEMAKRLDPTCWDIYKSLTYIYSSTGRSEEAIKTGQKALELNTDDANTYNNLAWTYATSKEPFFDLRLAYEYAQKAVELTMERQPAFLDTLAEVDFRRGDRDGAIAMLRKARAAVIDPKGNVAEIQGHFKRLFPDETL